MTHMRGLAKFFGNLVVLSLLMAHLLLVSLFLAPSSKLLGLIVEGDLGFLVATDIPPTVATFIATNKIEVKGDYGLSSKPFHQLLSGVLKIRRNKFMSSGQQLALDMNLLNFGENVVGLRRAALFYYKKPLAELSDPEWITLINLQKIFAKK
jgi:hypothetical protein